MENNLIFFESNDFSSMASFVKEAIEDCPDPTVQTLSDYLVWIAALFPGKDVSLATLPGLIRSCKDPWIQESLSSYYEALLVAEKEQIDLSSLSEEM